MAMASTPHGFGLHLSHAPLYSALPFLRLPTQLLHPPRFRPQCFPTHIPSSPLSNFSSLVSLSASVALLLSAQQSLAATIIKMGADEGTLVFVPASVSVAAGEKIIFLNNKGFPHNVVFEKDGVPLNVEAQKISHVDYMNEQGEQYVVLLTEKGTYKYFCEPHQSAGMYGEIIVN